MNIKKEIYFKANIYFHFFSLFELNKYSKNAILQENHIHHILYNFYYYKMNLLILYNFFLF